MPSPHRHTWAKPVGPRHAFRPPRYPVHRLDAAAADPWASIPPLPLLTDLFGEEIPWRRTQLQLAWDDAALHVRARCQEERLTLRPDAAPDGADFWRQDHVELRLLPDPAAPLRQLQFIVAADGRTFDSAGLWRRPGTVCATGTSSPDGWAVEARIPWPAAGMPSPREGALLRGLFARLRWGDGWPEISCCTPAQLGFPQAERFAEFALAGPAPVELWPERLAFGSGPLHDLPNVGVLLIHNRTTRPRKVHVLLRREDAAGALLPEPAAGSDLYLLAPGANRIPLVFELERPRFTRFRLCLDEGGRAPERELAAVTLRAAPPPLPGLAQGETPAVRHPYLYFDEVGLATFRRRAASPVLAPLAAQLGAAVADLSGTDLPPPGTPVCFDFDAGSMNWFRVARESMLRDGAGGQRPAPARIWSLLPPAAQEACRDVVRTVTPTPAQLDVLLPALNALLRRRDLYAPAAFERVHLPPEGYALLGRGIDALAEPELCKLNRILFQSAVECCHKFNVHLLGRIGQYLAKYLLSGDRRLVDLATRTVRAAADTMLPEAAFHLHEGNASPGLALAYDLFHPLLSEAERADWRRLLVKLLDLYLQTARQRGWTVTAIPNANPVGNAGGGFLALALLAEEPDKAREALAFARKFVWNWLDYCSGPQGGNTEGAQYWAYGTESFLRFARLLEKVAGTDDGLLAQPAVRHAMNMIRVGLCNDGALHGVNDTVPVPAGGEIAWCLAACHDDPFALWYGDHALRWAEAARAAGREVPYSIAPIWGILFRPELPEAVAPPEPLPEAFLLSDIHYAILRSAPRWDCTLDAGLKGSRPPYTHHNQADTGSLFVDVRGERLLIDPGYYKPDPEHHCLPLIGGRGPEAPAAFTGAIVACESRGGLSYAACDATPAYRGAAQRVVRLLVLVGDEGLVLLDDVLPADPGATIRAQYQCGGPVSTAAHGRSVLIEGRQARLRLELLTCAEVRLAPQPERSLHDTHWGYHFADCRWFPVTADYRAAEAEPLVSVILDVTRGAPPAARLERGAGSLTVVLPSGVRIGFACGPGGWTLGNT